MGRTEAVVCACVCACTLGASARGAHASEDDDLSELSLEELMDVRVETASFVLDSRAEQPVAMTTISRDDIDESGARTLAELLNLYVPGFFLVEDQDDTIAAFRGFAPDNNSKTLLLIDGRPVDTEWFGGPPDAILNGLDLGWIDHVEVIRGPGSATLGQGALLGVINVIPRRDGGGTHARASLIGGTLGLAGGRVELETRADDLEARMYVAGLRLEGSPLRDDGWARTQENPTGYSVHDRGHHLKAADQRLVQARVRWRDVTLQVLNVAQWRDNYNFYRDREAVEQRLLAVTAGYETAVAPDLRISALAGYDRDQLAQLALDGTSLAGTREDRLTGRVVATYADEAKANRVALGLEVKRYEMGLTDDRGQNLIVNDKNTRPGASNDQYTWVRPLGVTSSGVFAEYAHRAGDRLTAFAGLRFDAHTRWGSAWTPRGGALVRITPTTELRAGIQSGFRGAVGVHYAGGFVHDGLLSAGNFDKVHDNPLLVAMGYGDLAQTQPERMYAAELAARYHRGGLQIEAVGFVDRMRNMIEAGVIFVGPDIATAPAEQRRIGGDPVGDWGGWFYFKNDPGTITSGGGELSVDWRSSRVDLRASHALTRVLALSSAAEQIGSIYVSGTADDPHFRAYPENITRVHARVRPAARAWLAASLVWFSRWYTPAGTGGVSDGAGHAWVDLAAGYRWRKLSAIVTVKNVTGTGGLWPMNSNAADPSISAGTPALEPRTAWLALTATL